MLLLSGIHHNKQYVQLQWKTNKPTTTDELIVMMDIKLCMLSLLLKATTRIKDVPDKEFRRIPDSGIQQLLSDRIRIVLLACSMSLEPLSYPAKFVHHPRMALNIFNASISLYYRAVTCKG